MAAPVCLTELEKVYNAIMALQTGKTVTSISFGERSVSYGAGQMPQLLEIYRTFYRTCGADSGFPNLSGGPERGPPARFSMI